MADSGHPPAELHERLLICRTIKLNAGAHGGHRRCCHAIMQKNAQNKPQIARLILCVHTTLQVYCNLFLTFCGLLQCAAEILRHRADQEFIVLHARGLPRRVHRELGQADVHRADRHERIGDRAERRAAGKIVEAGLSAKDIAASLGISPSAVYAELRRGRDGTRLPDKRLGYNAELAQLSVQQGLERRGRRTAGA